MRERAIKLILLAVSTLISLAGAELFFRLYLDWDRARDLERTVRGAAIVEVDTDNLGYLVRLSSVPDLIYELKPGLRGHFFSQVVRTNAAGMRSDSELTPKKPPGTTRLMGVGDSFMFGQGVANGETYLDVLEQRRRARGRSWETLNFAAPGYTTLSYAAMFEAKADLFAPDVVVVGVIGNDWEVPHFLLSGPLRRPLGSVILGTLWERFTPPLELVPISGTAMDMYYDFYDIEAIPPEFRHMAEYPGFIAAFERIHLVADRRGTEVVLFTNCMKKEEQTPGCDFPFAAGQREELWRKLEEWNFHLCTWGLRGKHLIPNDGHPNAEGHIALAEQLDHCLEGLGF